MQQVTSIYDEQRSVCNQILECILQPFDIQQIEASNKLRSTVVASISQGLTQLLAQNVSSFLPAKTMESLERRIFLASQESLPPSPETGRVTLDNVMDMFPEITGDGTVVKEYNAIRESVQESVALFNRMKESLKEVEVPDASLFTPRSDANAIMKRSQQLLDSLSSVIDEKEIARTGKKAAEKR